LKKYIPEETLAEKFSKISASEHCKKRVFKPGMASSAIKMIAKCELAVKILEFLSVVDEGI
jgi:hypothetical protein